MIISLLEAPMVTECLPNGTDGSTTSMMMNHFLIAILLKILFSKSHINGISRHLHSDFMSHELLRSALGSWNTERKGKTSLLLSGLLPRKELEIKILSDLNKSIFHELFALKIHKLY